MEPSGSVLDVRRSAVNSLTKSTRRLANVPLDREGLRNQWHDALNAGSIKQMTDGLKAPEESLPRGFVLANTIAALPVQSLYIFLAVLESLGRALGRARTTQDFWSFVLTLLGIAAAVSLPWSLLALWRLIRHGTPERSIGQIGRAVLDALEYEGSIDQRAGDFRVYANGNKDGTVFCWIGGGTGKDQAIFLRALKETMSPTDNPRYLLARGRIWRHGRRSSRNFLPSAGEGLWVPCSLSSHAPLRVASSCSGRGTIPCPGPSRSAPNA